MIFDEYEYLIANPDVMDAVENGLFSDGLTHYMLHGQQENRLLFDPNKSRIAQALYSINRQGKGLEIGPSINPIAPKALGFNVHIVDHLPTAQLKEKYKNHGVNIDSIEIVDFVWNGEPLSTLVRGENLYDYIIASHVIEHIPDVIQFLQECSKLLKPDGVLSLVIPDKRYCFDHFLPCSTTGQLIDAHDLKRIKPSRGQVFDSYMNASCTRSGSISWGIDNSEDLRTLHSDFEVVSELFIKSTVEGEYVDAHCWRFTPNVFKLLVSDLNLLKFIDMNILVEFDTKGCEFYMTLEKKKLNLNDARINILKNIHLDQLT